MDGIDCALEGETAVITLNRGENRFNPELLQSFFQVLDDVENNTEASTLVVKSADEKIFSNGIDLEWLIPEIQSGNTDAAAEFFFSLNRLFKRTLTSPMITVVAITGHAFAGGAIWACAFDFRFMRSDRGFFCFPEIDLGIPFLPGMLALLEKAIPRYKMDEMILTGKRLTAEECEKHHIVTKACHIDNLMKETLAFAKSLNKKRGTVREIKARHCRDVLHALDVLDVPYIESKQFHIG